VRHTPLQSIFAAKRTCRLRWQLCNQRSRSRNLLFLHRTFCSSDPFSVYRWKICHHSISRSGRRCTVCVPLSLLDSEEALRRDEGVCGRRDWNLTKLWNWRLWRDMRFLRNWLEKFYILCVFICMETRLMIKQKLICNTRTILTLDIFSVSDSLLNAILDYIFCFFGSFLLFSEFKLKIICLNAILFSVKCFLIFLSTPISLDLVWSEKVCQRDREKKKL